MASKDVDMQDAAVAEEGKKEAITPVVDPDAVLLAELKGNIALIEKSVLQKEERFMSRALRQFTSVRRRVKSSIIRQLVEFELPESVPQRAALLEAINKVPEAVEMEQASSSSSSEAPVDAASAAAPIGAGMNDQLPQKRSAGTAGSTNPAFPEILAYMQMIALVLLIDNKQNETAVAFSTSVMEALSTAPSARHTLDQVAARILFYYARSYELSSRQFEIRTPLLNFLRTATLRHDVYGQTTCLNLLLRNYLSTNQYDMADKLIAKTSGSLPEQTRLNNQMARYHYYLGRVKAVQLDYSDALTHLRQALRKAPTKQGHGFRLAVTKLLVVVQLLTGEIPDRSVFLSSSQSHSNAAKHSDALLPYYELTKAVRVGDLEQFHKVVESSKACFTSDKTLTLVHRIRQNVIKAGLRKISLAYSRISLQDICTKLHLGSVEDAESVVAKAIKDGVIEGLVDHERQFLASREQGDVYSSTEPSTAFNKRIQFCLDLHTQAVKALRFTDDSTKVKENEYESPEERKKRLESEEADLQALEEADDDEDEEL